MFINLLATNIEKQLYVKDILTTFRKFVLISEFSSKMSVEILLFNRNAIRKKKELIYFGEFIFR